MENRLGSNRKSPKNEKEYIEAYKQMNKKANRNDKLDIAAVEAKDGTPGHGLELQSANRSHDNKLHRIIDFIPDTELRKKMK